MNATSLQNTTPGCVSISTGEIDCSFRAPLFVLFPSAAFWLMIASVFGFIASLKFHAPDLLSNCASMTYGRVHAAASTAFLYGFAIQAGFGVGIWILARLGKNKISQPLMIAF